jgi:hypothetical protein
LQSESSTNRRSWGRTWTLTDRSAPCPNDELRTI